MPQRPNAYAAGPLDRAAHLRRDRAWLSDRLARPDTRVLPLWQAKTLVGGPREAPRLAFLAAADALRRGHPAAEPYFLGVHGDVAYFAADVSHVADPADDALLAGLGAFVDLRTVGPLMPADEAAIAAYARGIVWWHARHRFCGVCGAPAEPQDAGHTRRCTDPACGAVHFPRTDPAVIMLVTDGDRCLLGREARFPPGMHSTLAGFVEPGEALEDAVAREVFEETGVRVVDVRYHSSQPWPFPQSIMLGFHARAVTTEITIDPTEIEHAAWYRREDLIGLEETEAFRLPRRDSIARRLIEDWLRGPD
jgi:NAD+ diphosphatase